MDPLARLGAHLGAALQGNGTEADRLLLLHTGSHLLAALTALAIAAGILRLLYQRSDFDMRWLLLLAATALLASATSHGTVLWTLIHPDRWLAGWALFGASLGAFATALLFWMELPDVARLPSGRQLRRANAALMRQNGELQQRSEQTQRDFELLRDALAAAPPLALLSPDGRWLHASAALAPLLGAAPAELSQQSPRQLFGERLTDADTETVDTAAGRQWKSTPLTDAGGRMRARLIQPQADSKATPEVQASLAEQTRRADEAIALLQHTLAEKEKSEADLARRAEQLQRNAARLERLGTRITELTGTDPITGLISSQQLAQRLDLALAVAKRHGDPFAVLVIAADPVDDLAPGDDTLLGALGGVLRAELRESDAAARCDEERICVLLPRTGAAEATQLVERVRRRLAATPLAIPDGRTLRLSCSIGTSEWKSGQGIGDVLAQAAEAQRNARGRRRNSAAR